MLTMGRRRSEAMFCEGEKSTRRKISISLDKYYIVLESCFLRRESFVKFNETRVQIYGTRRSCASRFDTLRASAVLRPLKIRHWLENELRRMTRDACASREKKVQSTAIEWIIHDFIEKNLKFAIVNGNYKSHRKESFLALFYFAIIAKHFFCLFSSVAILNARAPPHRFVVPKSVTERERWVSFFAFYVFSTPAASRR